MAFCTYLRWQGSCHYKKGFCNWGDAEMQLLGRAALRQCTEFCLFIMGARGFPSHLALNRPPRRLEQFCRRLLLYEPLYAPWCTVAKIRCMIGHSFMQKVFVQGGQILLEGWLDQILIAHDGRLDVGISLGLQNRAYPLLLLLIVFVMRPHHLCNGICGGVDGFMGKSNAFFTICPLHSLPPCTNWKIFAECHLWTNQRM